jgi:hypothetical protein
VDSGAVKEIRALPRSFYRFFEAFERDFQRKPEKETLPRPNDTKSGFETENHI